MGEDSPEVRNTDDPGVIVRKVDGAISIAWRWAMIAVVIGSAVASIAVYVAQMNAARDDFKDFKIEIRNSIHELGAVANGAHEEARDLARRMDAIEKQNEKRDRQDELRDVRINQVEIVLESAKRARKP